MKKTFSTDTTRRLTETAVMIALATALSYVQIFKLPMGGSITLFSQVPIMIIGYRYGLLWGCSTGMIYGLLQMLFGLENFSYVHGIGSYLILALADYLLAFMVLGLGGAMFKKLIKNQAVSLGLGAFVGSLLRFVCHFVSGVTIWGEYADGWKSVWAYSAGYNGSYMAAEAAISVIAVVFLSTVLDFSSPKLLRKRKQTASADNKNK